MSKSVALIFGGEAKVKIMRLFVFNPNSNFTPKEVGTRSKERPNIVRRELNTLLKAGLVRKRGKTYSLNGTYKYKVAIENFLVDASPISHKEIIKRLSRAGNMKLILVSGTFLHDKDARVDMLIVGDHIKPSTLVSTISYIEAQLGKEIRYASFETPDFSYRLGVYDKLIRDIMEHPHQKIVNKLGI